MGIAKTNRAIKPYYQDEQTTIYNADCLEVMPQLLDHIIDLTITSPPFNLGKDHHTGDKHHNPYFDDMNEKEYQKQQSNVLRAIWQLTKADGSLFYQHKNRIKAGVSITPYSWILKSDWKIKQEIVWFNRSQNFDKCRFYPMTERIYWLAKNKTTQLINTINQHDLWKIKPTGLRNKHTRAFPKTLVSNVISCFPNANTVLDPFLGSGTTARAAKDLGRKCIGIEISKEYCDIAIERLRQGVLAL